MPGAPRAAARVRGGPLRALARSRVPRFTGECRNRAPAADHSVHCRPCRAHAGRSREHPHTTRLRPHPSPPPAGIVRAGDGGGRRRRSGGDGRAAGLLGRPVRAQRPQSPFHADRLVPVPHRRRRHAARGLAFRGSRPLPQPLRTHPRGAGRGARRTRPLGRPRIDDRAGRRPGRTGARRNLQGPARHQCGPARRPHAGPRRIGLPVPDRCGPGDPRPRGVRRIPAGGHHRPSQDRPGHRRDGRLLLRTGAALPDLVGHRPGRRRHARADHRRRGGRADDDPRHGPDRPLRRPRPHPGLLRPGRGHGGRLVPGLAARARHPRGTDPARRRSASLGDGRGVLAVAHRERLRRRPRRGRPGDPRLRAVEQADRR